MGGMGWARCPNRLDLDVTLNSCTERLTTTTLYDRPEPIARHKKWRAHNALQRIKPGVYFIGYEVYFSDSGAGRSVSATTVAAASLRPLGQVERVVHDLEEVALLHHTAYERGARPDGVSCHVATAVRFALKRYERLL
jgi:hypothetical protein